jgi:hypothetical protein
MRNEIPITYGGKFEFNQPRFKILPLCAISCSIWRTPTCLSSQTCPTWGSKWNFSFGVSCNVLISKSGKT